MNITSRQLKAFLLTARCQSFSRAAEQLHITQSGMSLLIRELEEQIGFRLFDRTTRHVSLTEFGTQFLPIADRSVLELEAAAKTIGRSASAADRRLVVGATPILSGKLMPAAIGEFARRDPGLEIVLRDADRGTLIKLVGSGEIDVALGCFIEPLPGVRRTPLHRFSLMAIQSEADADRLGRPLRWDDLVEADLIGIPAQNPVQQMIDRQLQRHGRKSGPQAAFGYLETVVAMVEAGAGTAVLPGFAIPACDGHRVIVSPLENPRVLVPLYAIMDRGRKLPRGAEDFAGFIKDYVGQWATSIAPQRAKSAARPQAAQTVSRSQAPAIEVAETAETARLW